MTKTKLLALCLAALLTMSACVNETPDTKETESSEIETNETAAPETDAPETDSVETDAPETDAPDVDSPYPVKSLTINGIDIDEYVIAVNTAAGGVMETAAAQLQYYIEQTTGATLSIVDRTAAGPRILIDETIIDNDDALGVYTDENGLILAGTAKRSALYAVYNFLENFLGWRFFASDTEVCYSANSIALADIDYTYDVPGEIRGIYELDYHNKNLSVKRYQNDEGKRRMSHDEALGYDENYCPNGIHTFGELSETGDGYSTPQPCLNNSAIRETMLKNIRAWLDNNWGVGANANREIKTIHVSQNDNSNYCTCADCKADIETYGTPAGSIVEFVNWVATDLETYNGGKYKDVKIMTFAYQYSLDCPSNIVCHENVVIQFALIDMCFQHAIDDPNCTGSTEHTPNYSLPRTRSNTEILEEMEKWRQICSNFFLWDYGINCRYFLCPFPNFDTMLANYKYFSEIGLWGYTYQANSEKPSAEFGVLRSYLIAKITENPDMTEEEYNNHINEFLKAYYGDNAWEYIRAYFDYLQELSNEANVCYSIYNSPELIYGKLNDPDNPNSFLSKSDWLVEIFENALNAEGLTDVQKQHITYLRTSCEYLRLGAVHETAMAGDEEAQNAQKEAVLAFYESLKALDQTKIDENFNIPGSIDPSVNLRTWNNNTTRHWYNETFPTESWYIE